MERLLTVALLVSGRWPFDVMMQWGWQRSPASRMAGLSSMAVRTDATAAGTLDPTGDKAGEGAAVSLRLLVTADTRCGKTLADQANPLVRRGARRVGHRLSTEAATADVDSFRQRQGVGRA